MKKDKRKIVARMVWNSLSWITPAWEGSNTIQAGVFASLFVFSAIMLWKFIKQTKKYELPARDVSKGHRWYSIDIFSNTAHCSICNALIVDGYFCDSCGVCADHSCLKKADKNINCKLVSTTGSSMKHHWVKGNLPPNSFCDICDAECRMEAALTDYRCCWCQRTVHTNCLLKISEYCDFGRYKSFVVPPFCVKLKLAGLKGRRHLVVGEVHPPPYRPWNPLVVIANRKSGDNEGEVILRAFRSYLNPCQVIDLHDLMPENGLEWCRLVPNHICRVLIAGGDGSVGWVLNAIDKLKIEPQPQVCILPLGTGNDLSRVLGWGSSYTEEIEVKKVLEQISTASVVKLDRWKVRINPRPFGIRLPAKEHFMSNYASVGADALVTLNFHKTRESKFYLFNSRLLNKFLYFIYGTKDCLERECKNLHLKMELYLDNKLISLPEVEAVIILNIPSWGAGVKPWGMGGDSTEFEPQRYDDGVLEVIGVYSSFHIAQLQIGLSEPVRIGQAKSVKIKLHERLPLQIDGEPWEQPPAEIIIQFHNQATMLSNRRLS